MEMVKDAKRAAHIIEHVRSLVRKGSSAQEVVDVNRMPEIVAPTNVEKAALAQ